MADTPEMRRLQENTKIQSQVCSKFLVMADVRTIKQTGLTSGPSYAYSTLISASMQITVIL